MRKQILGAVACVVTTLASSNDVRAYDIDCAIILCMAGGFPPSAVCSAAYAEMIRRITPWPVLPPFGVCTYAGPTVTGGAGAVVGQVDTNTSDFDWMNRTRVLWWSGNERENREGDRIWSWTVNSCDGENQSCQIIARQQGQGHLRRSGFVSENGQAIDSPVSGYRAVSIEYGDHDGNLAHSEWFSY